MKDGWRLSQEELDEITFNVYKHQYDKKSASKITTQEYVQWTRRLIEEINALQSECTVARLDKEYAEKQQQVIAEWATDIHDLLKTNMEEVGRLRHAVELYEEEERVKKVLDISN